jgi:hypothetical protein
MINPIPVNRSGTGTLVCSARLARLNILILAGRNPKYPKIYDSIEDLAYVSKAKTS